jgi:hypothetical protein
MKWKLEDALVQSKRLLNSYLLVTEYVKKP